MVDLLNTPRRAKLAVAGAVATVGLTVGAAGIAWANSTSQPTEIGWGTVADVESGATTPQGQDCPNHEGGTGTGSTAPQDRGGDL